MASFHDTTIQMIAECDDSAENWRDTVEELEEEALGLELIYRQKLDEVRHAKEELDAVMRRRACLEATLVPVSQIPDELMSMIFELFVADWECEVRKDERAWSRLAAFLLAVTQTSARWRRIALTTPRLWRNLRVLPRWDREWPCYYPFEMCVERSRASPLSLWARGCGDLDHAVQYLVKREAGLDRIHDLHISEDIIYSLFENVNDVFKRLVCPNMETLSIKSVSRLSSGSLFALLRSHSAIRSLTMQSVYLILDEPAPLDGSTILPAIESLRYQDANHMDLEYVLSLISPAQLKKMHITTKSRVSGAPFRLTLPAGPFHSLSELSLGGTMRNEDMLSILHFTPNITLLQVQGAYNESNCDDLLHGISDSDNGVHCLIPHLQTITFDYCTVSLLAVLLFIDRRLVLPTRAFRSIGMGTLTMHDFSELDRQKINEKVELFRWNTPYWSL